jgi:hypothetical protein
MVRFDFFVCLLFVFIVKLLIFCEFCEKNMSYVQKLNHNVENTDVISFYPVVEWKTEDAAKTSQVKKFCF